MQFLKLQGGVRFFFDFLQQKPDCALASRTLVARSLGRRGDKGLGRSGHWQDARQQRCVLPSSSLSSASLARACGASRCATPTLAVGERRSEVARGCLWCAGGARRPDARHAQLRDETRRCCVWRTATPVRLHRRAFVGVPRRARLANLRRERAAGASATRDSRRRRRRLARAGGRRRNEAGSSRVGALRDASDVAHKR